MVYIAITGRINFGIEQLSMFGNISNISIDKTCVRQVWIVDANRYVEVRLPYIDGSAPRRAYTALLTEELMRMNENVCSRCAIQDFSKNIDAKSFQNTRSHMLARNIIKLPKENDIDDWEAKVIASCAVEDITGFMGVEKSMQMSRRSAINFSKYEPVKEISVMSLRDETISVRRSRKLEEQIILREAIRNAYYYFMIVLNTGMIGKHQLSLTHYGQISQHLTIENVEKRTRAALYALETFLQTQRFGARQSKSLSKPVYEALVISLSDGLFEPTPAFDRVQFVRETVEKQKSMSRRMKIKTYAYVPWLDAKECEFTYCFDTAAKTISAAIDDAINNNL